MLELRATLDPSFGRSRVVALAAVARAGRDRAARMREELSHRQLQEVLEKQKAAIQRLEHELTQDFR